MFCEGFLRRTNNLREEDINSISEFLEYFQKETDRGAALIGAAMIDTRLERILDMCLLDNKSKKGIFEGPNAVLGNFHSKIIMCHLLGFITDKEANEIQIIRRIRNEFAHQLDNISFFSQPVTDYCLQLNADTPGELKKENKYRSIFINSVVLTSLASLVS